MRSMQDSYGGGTAATAGAQPALRIGPQGLGAGEAGLLRALLTLIATGRDTAFPWVYAERDADATVAREPASGRMVLRIGGKVRAWLAGPLTARELESCLDSIAAGDEPPAPAAAERAVPAASAPAASAAQGVDAGRHRLRRWPPPELLHTDKQRVRLATFLSRQWLTVEELAAASHVPPERCRVFVQMLQAFGLLNTAPPAQQAQPALKAPRAQAQPARWSLVRSLRRKLGLEDAA